jgi:hypothetical protein
MWERFPVDTKNHHAIRVDNEITALSRTLRIRRDLGTVEHLEIAGSDLYPDETAAWPTASMAV